VTAAAFGVTATPTQTQLISLSPTPTLSWQASAGGISYDVYLFNGRTAIEQTGLTATFWRTPNLGAEEWQWWVRSIDSAGNAGPWNDAATFDSSGRAIGLSPLATANPTPTFTWTEVFGADRYILQVDNLTTGSSQVIRENALGTTNYTPNTTLAAGSYRFWVKALSNNNPIAGFWSKGVDFTIV